jgi:hypothetical protein
MKMFKTRLKQWDFKKNCTADEVARFLRFKRYREAAVYSSESKTAGRDVEFERVERYIKRKTAQLESMEEASLKFTLQHRLRSPTPTLQNPKVLENPEIIFASIRDYVIGSVDNGTWILRDEFTIENYKDSIGEDAVSQLNSYITSAMNMLIDSTVYQAGPVLLQGFSLIEQCLQEDHFRTLTTIFSLMHDLQHWWPEVAKSFLNQFANLALAILPRMHPLRQILKRLSLLDSADLENTIRIAWRSMLDQFESISGPRNAVLLELWASFDRICGDPSSELSQRRYENLLEKFQYYEVTYSKNDPRTLIALILLVESQYARMEYKETERLATEICTRIDQSKSQARSINRLDSAFLDYYKALALEPYVLFAILEPPKGACRAKQKTINQTTSIML